MSWTFLPQRPGSKRRDPTQGEFFATDRVDAVADGLVREAFQNSLDAGCVTPVTVGIHLNHTGVDAGPMFDGLDPHLTGSDDRLTAVRTEPCRYLVFEDFGTTGLRGDPHEFFLDDGETGSGNEFYFFFRAEGRSSKAGGTRGSWGVGKYTFIQASRIRTIFGVTVRGDGRSLAMGQSVLRNHIADGVNYEPDGTWGRTITVQGDAAVVPHELGEIEHTELHHRFSISRTDEPGLSIVVPYIDDRISIDTMRAATLRNYAVAIAGGELDIHLTSDETDLEVIDAESLPAALAGTGELAAIRQEVALAEHLRSRSPLVELEGIERPQWGTLSIDDSTRQTLLVALERGKPFSVRVPVQIDDKLSGSTTVSHFDVAFDPDHGASGPPAFYRRGIRINDAGAGRSISGARALVLVRDEPLAAMLGMAEGPAHTDWSASTERFRGRFGRGRDWIAFVKRAPAEILRLAREGSSEQNLVAAAEFFALPTDRGRRRAGTDPADTDGGTAPVVPPTSSRRPPVTIAASGRTGFRLTLGDGHAAGDIVDIRAAYDTSTGDPFRAWSILDFDLTELSVEIDGLEMLHCEPSTLRYRIVDPAQAELIVRGFDPIRDLIVRADKVTST